MKFNQITGRRYHSYAVDRAEETFAGFSKWLADVNPIYIVHVIIENETSFVIQTRFFYVVCSKKFYSVAKIIKGYLNEVAEASGQVGVPLLMLTGFNEKGYVTYEFGYDAEEDCTCYPVVTDETDTFLSIHFHAELKPREKWENDQTDCVLSEEEQEMHNSRKPDPTSPKQRQRSRVNRKKPTSAS